MSFAIIIDQVRRKWWLLALGTILAMLLYIALNVRPERPSFVSEAKLFILPTAFRVELEPSVKTIDSDLPTDTGSKVDRRQALLALVQSPRIAAKVFSQIETELPDGLNDPNQLIRFVNGTVGGEVFLIRVTHEDPVFSAKLANAWAEAFETEANAIFGGVVVPSNLDSEVEAAKRAYDIAERQVIDFMATSELDELDHNINLRRGALDELLLSHQDTVRNDLASVADAYNQQSEIESLLDDLGILRQHLQTMTEPNLATYVSFTILQNRAFLSDNRYNPTSVAGPDRTNNISTSLNISPDQITALLPEISVDDLMAQIDSLMAILEERRTESVSRLSETETNSVARVQQAVEANSNLVEQLAGELNTLTARYETQQRNQEALISERDSAWNNYVLLANKQNEARIASSIGEGSIVRFAIPADGVDENIGTVNGLTADGVLLSGLIGFLASFGILLVWVFLDDKIRSVTQIERQIGVTALSQLPKGTPFLAGSPVTLSATSTPYAEAVRSLRTTLKSLDQLGQTLLITSVLPNEGKSSLASNLAVAMAKGSKKVILVDANLRRPKLHQAFGVANKTGVTSWLEDDRVVFESLLQVTPVAQLRVLTSGLETQQPSELLDSQRMVELISALKAHADVVIIDGTQISGVTDSLVLAGKVDSVLLVVQSGKDNASQIMGAYNQIMNVGGRVLGIVLNRTPGGQSDVLSGGVSGRNMPKNTITGSPAVEAVVDG